MFLNIKIEFTEEQVELLQHSLAEFIENQANEEVEALLHYVEEEVMRNYSSASFEEGEQTSGHGFNLDSNTDPFDSTFLANDPIKW